MSCVLIKPDLKIRILNCLQQRCGRLAYNVTVKDCYSFINLKTPYIRKASNIISKSLYPGRDFLKPCSSYYQKSEFCLSSLRSDLSSNVEGDEEDKEERYQEFVKRTLKLSDDGHNVLVIQPYVKWGNLKKRNTTPQLQLDEAIALIRTLPRWTVEDARIIPLMSLKAPRLFGKGNLNALSELVSGKKEVTAVFVSVNTLSPAQHEELEKMFKVPVFDRYTIVVQIFKLHAVTEEAKIQVAMGEMPYLWGRLGGGGETERRVLQDRERELKRRLNRLAVRRQLLRQKRERMQMPTVAVVGYTNAGKTALIKALTGQAKLRPTDALFATLDVTVHAGRLPSTKLQVLFVDTVGFLADLPTGLIQAFVTTLQDAMRADLIVHVRDASHPDMLAQHEHVEQTLPPTTTPVITVSNKIDLVGDECPFDLSHTFPVSATVGTGIERLQLEIEKKIIEATGQMWMKIRVSNGGPELAWLGKEATVVDVIADPNDYQFVFVDTIISEATLNKFKHKFISLKN